MGLGRPHGNRVTTTSSGWLPSSHTHTNKILLLVQIDEGWDRYCLRLDKHSTHVVRVLSCTKILLFFVQASMILNVGFWENTMARW